MMAQRRRRARRAAHRHARYGPRHGSTIDAAPRRSRRQAAARRRSSCRVRRRTPATAARPARGAAGRGERLATRRRAGSTSKLTAEGPRLARASRNRASHRRAAAAGAAVAAALLEGGANASIARARRKGSRRRARVCPVAVLRRRRRRRRRGGVAAARRLAPPSGGGRSPRRRRRAAVTVAARRRAAAGTRPARTNGTAVRGARRAASRRRSRRIQKAGGSRRRVYALVARRRRRRLVRAARDRDVRLLDARDGRCTARMEGHADRVWALAGAGATRWRRRRADKTVRLWRPPSDGVRARARLPAVRAGRSPSTAGSCSRSAEVGAAVGTSTTARASARSWSRRRGAGTGDRDAVHSLRRRAPGDALASGCCASAPCASGDLGGARRRSARRAPPGAAGLAHADGRLCTAGSVCSALWDVRQGACTRARPATSGALYALAERDGLLVTGSVRGRQGAGARMGRSPQRSSGSGDGDRALRLAEGITARARASGLDRRRASVSGGFRLALAAAALRRRWRRRAGDAAAARARRRRRASAAEELGSLERFGYAALKYSARTPSSTPQWPSPLALRMSTAEPQLCRRLAVDGYRPSGDCRLLLDSRFGGDLSSF